MKAGFPTNSDIAVALDRIVDLLEVQGANTFRVGACRPAAKRIDTEALEFVGWVLDENCGQLETLPDIEKRIVATIYEFVETGKIGLLERSGCQFCNRRRRGGTLPRSIPIRHVPIK
jgi:DNA polymerase (family 10)